RIAASAGADAACAIAVAPERLGDVERAVLDPHVRGGRRPRAGPALHSVLLGFELGEALEQEEVVRQPRDLFVEDRARVVEEATRREEVGFFEGRLELGRPRSGGRAGGRRLGLDFDGGAGARRATKLEGGFALGRTLERKAWQPFGERVVDAVDGRRATRGR